MRHAHASPSATVPRDRIDAGVWRAGGRGPGDPALLPGCYDQPCFTSAGAVFQLLGMNVMT